MTDRLAEAEALLAILDAGSIAAGAQRLGLTPSATSRLLARLETRLGARLAHRTTRSLQPTAEGLAFAAEARAALDRLTAAEAAANTARAAPSGMLRVNASVPYALHRIIPRLPAFRAANPAIELNLALTDRVVDLAAEGADVAVRVGPVRSVSGLRARLIHEEGRVVVAAPSYLAKRGVPETPADLRHHDRLDFDFARAQTAWPFQVGKRRVLVPTEATIRTDGGVGLRAMVLAGLGLARLAEFHVADDLAAGRLVEVLQPYNPGDRVEVHALYPADHGVAVAARVRVFIDFLTR
jgi:DNA-binding transcriptional LysR family regulator